MAHVGYCDLDGPAIHVRPLLWEPGMPHASQCVLAHAFVTSSCRMGWPHSEGCPHWHNRELNPTFVPMPLSPTAPSITSSATASGNVNASFTYQITASGNPAPDSFDAAGLPAGLSVNAAGLISGTPTTQAVTNVTISATNSEGTGTSTLVITINPAIVAAPTVTALSPTTASTLGGTSITITGTSFAGATAVMFGTNAATSFTVDSGTQITAIAPARSTGIVNVRVTTPSGQSATAAANQLSYITSLATIQSLTPNTAAAGTSIVIVGTHFQAASAVNFGATPATSFTIDNANKITAVVPAGSGTVNVTVTNPYGNSAARTFTYVGALSAPVITSANTANAIEGQPFSYTITASGNPAPAIATGFNATGLPTSPAWLSRANNVVSGTPPAGSGNSSVTFTVTATNSQGTSPGVLVTVSIAEPTAGWTVTRAGANAYVSGVTFDHANPIALSTFTGWQPAYLADFGVAPDWIYTPAMIAARPIKLFAKMTSDAAEYEVHWDGEGPGSPAINHITEWGFDGQDIYIVGANSTGSPIALRLVKA